MESARQPEEHWSNVQQARSSQGAAADPWWMKIEGPVMSDVEDVYDHFHLSRHQKALESVCKNAQKNDRHVQAALGKLDIGDRQRLLLWQRHVVEYVNHREHVSERYMRKVELGQNRTHLLQMEEEEKSSSEDEMEDEDKGRSAPLREEDAEEENVTEDGKGCRGSGSPDPVSEPTSPTASTASPTLRARRPSSIRSTLNRIRTGVKVISFATNRNSVSAASSGQGREGGSRRQSLVLPSIGEDPAAVSERSVRARRPSNAGKGFGADAVIAGSPTRRLSNVGRSIVEDASSGASSGRAKLSNSSRP
eukprot:TRINITY_DN940_c0_g1_i1.p1 TRINITY_DN940_c0_g1~~TRINITY_DN940_c0_g1_i1.p1  ORF type:complete len:324 (+),score=47.68 TRINITY_DN940_c0_g1_i1:52-972(+)